MTGEARDLTRLGQSAPARAGYRALRAVGLLAARGYFRLEVVGADRLPVGGAYVIAPVHRSNLDFVLPALVVKRRVRWMAKDSLFKGGLVDRFLYTFGAFPVRRDAVDRQSIRTCEQLLAAGQPVVMFPEGRRKEGPVVESLFDGPSFVACRQRVPVVPIGIGGSDRAMPIGSKMIHPARVVLVIGEPLYPDVALEGRIPRSQVTALTSRLRESVQSLFDDAKSRV